VKSLFGYGISTKEIAKSGGWHIYDDKFKYEKKDEYGNILLPSNAFNPKNSSIEITSPGIPPSHPLIKKAKNLISEFDYFYHNNFQIWVTGTNGKTTTTQMIHYLIDNSEIGGNIGISLGKLAKNKIWVIEASSFQLYYTKYAKPNIFVVLPIKQDHLSWHGSFSEYVKAKLSPLKRMTPRDIVIMPKEFDQETKAFKILYENEEDLIKRFNFKTHFKKPFLLDEALAKTVYYILFFKEKSLENFKVDKHKMQEIIDYKKRVWIDDSKATNIDATINALKRFENQKIYLIIGGVTKGQNFKELFEEFKKYDIELFIIGKESEFFQTLANKYKIKNIVCKELKNAVKEIDKLHSKNSIAILSPACASFDQFKSYKDRGEKFIKYIKELK